MNRRDLMLAFVAAPLVPRAGAAEGERLVLRGNGREVATYHRAPQPPPSGVGPLQARSAYLHPVLAPNGAVVTDDFPPDHRHQRGVFFAWTRTQIGGREPDFWNLGGGTGRIRAVGAVLRENTLTAEHVWEMREGEEWTAVMDERWTLTLLPPRFSDPNAPDAAFVLDLTSRQTPRVKIELPEYRYGGMAVRGARPWHTTPGSYAVLTSAGKDRLGADGSRAWWVDQSGPIGDRTAGIALLEYPTNLGAPNLLRVPPDHPYAVFSAPKGGPRTLEAAKEYVFRYRLVAHNGPADAVALEAEWKRFVG
jgi:hypothetical protein